MKASSLLHPYPLTILCALSALCLSPPLQAQAAIGDWYQVEVSVFSNEAAADRREETYAPEQFNPAYPPELRRLDQVLDLLLLPEMQVPLIEPEVEEVDEPRRRESRRERRARQERERLEREAAARIAEIAAAGPAQPKPPGDLRMPDPPRDAYLLMPDSLSDFQQTNRALDRAGDHRLLFHGIWRQPLGAFDATGVDSPEPIFISGGIVRNLQTGLHNELEGTLRLGFNRARDRIIVAADLWLSEFTGDDEATGWYLPPRPTHLARARAGLDYRDPRLLENLGERMYQPEAIYQLQEEREMRSEEFHYFDQPAFGLVILLKSYERPEPPPLPIAEVGPR